MHLEQCPRWDDLERAHRDENVQRLSTLLVAFSDQKLLALAIQQIHADPESAEPHRANLQVYLRNTARDRSEQLAAQEVLARAYAIATSSDPSPSLLRGAFLERFVYELLSARPLPVRSEIRFVFADGKSMCVDVVGIADAETHGSDWFETYEAKVTPWDLTQYILDQLAWIRDEADSDLFPKDVLGTVATLQSREALAAAMDDLQLTVSSPLYRASIENILGLAVGIPVDRLT